jgi:hypothetical protein
MDYQGQSEKKKSFQGCNTTQEIRFQTQGVHDWQRIKMLNIPKLLVLCLLKIQAQIFVVDDSSRQVLNCGVLGKLSGQLPGSDFLGSLLFVCCLLLKS